MTWLAVWQQAIGVVEQVPRPFSMTMVQKVSSAMPIWLPRAGPNGISPGHSVSAMQSRAAVGVRQRGACEGAAVGVKFYRPGDGSALELVVVDGLCQRYRL